MAYPTEAMIEAFIVAQHAALSDGPLDTAGLRAAVAAGLVAAERAAWSAIDRLPKEEGNFLAYMSEPMFGSRIQAARTGKAAVIGSAFAFDLSKRPTHIRPLPAGPEAS